MTTKDTLKTTYTYLGKSQNKYSRYDVVSYLSGRFKIDEPLNKIEENGYFLINLSKKEKIKYGLIDIPHITLKVEVPLTSLGEIKISIHDYDGLCNLSYRSSSIPGSPLIDNSGNILHQYQIDDNRKNNAKRVNDYIYDVIIEDFYKSFEKGENNSSAYRYMEVSFEEAQKLKEQGILFEGNVNPKKNTIIKFKTKDEDAIVNLLNDMKKNTSKLN